MCYFGPPPTGVRNIHTGEIKPASQNGYIYHPDEPQIKTEGFYYVCGSGTYYTYYDGVNYWPNHDDFGKITEFCLSKWPDTSGYPPIYFGYSFLYPECEHDSPSVFECSVAQEWSTGPSKILLFENIDFEVLANNKRTIQKYLDEQKQINNS